MAGRSGRRRVDHSSPLVDLDLVFADDALVDAISTHSGREHGSGALLTADPLTELLGSWRRELALPPVGPLPTLNATVPRQPSAPTPARSIRPALAVAAAIAALLVGSASISAKDATPDSALWALTEVLWPSRAESVESVSHVQDALREAKSALDDHRPQDAQIALLRATVELGNVDDVDGRSNMQQEVVMLWVQAGPQNLPADTLPPEFVKVVQPTGAVTRPVAGSILPSTATAATVPAPAPAPMQAAAVASSPVAPTSQVPSRPTLAQPQLANDASALTVRSSTPVGDGSSLSTAESPQNPSVSPPAAASSAGSTPQPTPSVPSPPAPTVDDAAAPATAEHLPAPQQSAPSPTPSTVTVDASE